MTDISERTPEENLFEALVDPRQFVRRAALTTGGTTFLEACWWLAKRPAPAKRLGFILLVEQEIVDLAEYLGAAANLQREEVLKSTTAFSAMSGLTHRLVLELIGPQEDPLTPEADLQIDIEQLLAERVEEILEEGRATLMLGLESISRGCDTHRQVITMDDEDEALRQSLIEDVAEYVRVRKELLGRTAQGDFDSEPEANFGLLQQWHQLQT